MAIDILRRAGHPLHISEIIAQVKAKHGVNLDRESLVSALVEIKRRNPRHGTTRTLSVLSIGILRLSFRGLQNRLIKTF